MSEENQEQQKTGPDLGQPEFNEEPEVEVLLSAEKTSEQQTETPISEIVSTTSLMIFGFVATRRGPHWALSEQEATELGKKLEAVLLKYFPEVETGPEVALIVTVAGVMGPRLIADQIQGMNNDENGKKTEPPAQE